MYVYEQGGVCGALYAVCITGIESLLVLYIWNWFIAGFSPACLLQPLPGGVVLQAGRVGTLKWRPFPQVLACPAMLTTRSDCSGGLSPLPPSTDQRPANKTISGV